MKKLTIVIPTYNRHPYLIRSINYWSLVLNQYQEFTLLILDGSEKKLDYQKYFHESITYFHNPVSVHERLSKAGEMINTDMVVMISDDEFLLPSALRHGINYLEAYSEFAMCTCVCLGFKKAKKINDPVRLFPMYLDAITKSRSEYILKDRLLNHFSYPYIPLVCNSICRKDVWVNNFNIVNSIESNKFGVGEIVAECSGLIQGKLKVLRELYWLRSFDISPSFSSDPESCHNPVNNFSDTTFSELNIITSNIAGYYSDKLKANSRDLFSAIYEALNSYILLYDKKPKYSPNEIFLKDLRTLQFNGGMHLNTQFIKTFFAKNKIAINTYELNSILDSIQQFNVK